VSTNEYPCEYYGRDGAGPPTDLKDALAALHDAERDEEADDLDRDQQLVLHARGAEERRSRDVVDKMQHVPCAVQPPVPCNEFAGAATVTQCIVQNVAVHQATSTSRRKQRAVLN
jgi:hypothetical protein